MKTYAIASALLVALALPALATEAGLSSLPFAERAALAQPADPITEVARQRFADGVKAYDSGRYEDARGAFLQAYALKRNPLLLMNLAQSELRAGYAEDAGTHFQQFVREVPTASADQKAVAEKGIADAKKKAAYLVVIVDASGAQVSVDGVAVGKAPLLDPVFVKAGRHTVVATYAGKSATAAVDARTGAATAANLVLGTGGTPAPVAVAPVPTPAPASPPAATPAPSAPTSTAPASSTPAEAYPEPPAAGLGLTTAPTSPQPDSTTDTAGKESFFEWYSHKPLAWAGTALTVGGLVVGIVGVASASNDSAQVDDITQQIQTQTAKDGIKINCNAPPSGYAKACSTLSDSIDSHDTNTVVAGVGFALAGVGAVGTVVYTVFDWYLPQRKASARGFAPHIGSVAPIVAPTVQGLAVAGSF
jgi:hypothetical protein